ncbi:MAG: anaerobic sulfatase maturase [Spirochaetes bacterium]|nr:MAG: anaerobic sulfatase maturase [Spirochaetota bacterium]
MKNLESVLIKPAGPDCNMACTYCFYSSKSGLFPETKIHRMDDSVLKRMIRQIMHQGGSNLSFGWQGGEPTLMGREFFEKAVNYTRIYGRAGQTVANGLQTNGILIDKNWAEFLYEYKFLVGLSLDGPKHIHDRYRLLKGGKPSWGKVVRARDILLNRGVDVNALSVVTDYSVRYPEEIYEFHKNNGLNYMQFIPCVEADPLHPGRIANFSVTPEDYGKFLCKIFDLWVSDFKKGTPTTSIRWFDSILFTYAGMEAPECTLQKECGKYVVIEHNGDVYSCDFFVEPGWKLGNITDGRIIDMLNSPLQKEFGLRKTDLPQECLNCPWLKHCWGGCPKYRQYSPKTNLVHPIINTSGTERAQNKKATYLCAAYKIFFGHADSTFKKLASKIP